jgi:hypothetical protein
MAKTAQHLSHGRRSKERLWTAVFVAALLVTTGVMLTADTGDTRFGIAAGVLGSLIASFMGLVFSVYVVGESPGDAAIAKDRLDRSLLDLEAAVPLVAQCRSNHIAEIRPKHHYSAEEWLAVLDETTEHLLLVGHALDKWCRDAFRLRLDAAIKRLTASEKPVELLLLPRNGANVDQISRQRGTDYSRRVDLTLSALRDIHAQLSSAERMHLDVRTLHPDVAMPYMLVANERRLVTCAYPTTESSSRMLTMTLSPASAAAEVLLEDRRKLAAKHAEPVDLANY